MDTFLGLCHTVCPCEPMTATSLADSFACLMVWLATRANISPTATCSRHTASTVPVWSSDRICSRNADGYGRVRWASSVMRKVKRPGLTSTMAQSTPSMEVPDINPRHFMNGVF